ncbi:MAG: nitroreductase, partial [Microthrixaceae bacterium]|nr:nitroreductase [Microthrixaceae bacterium]
AARAHGVGSTLTAVLLFADGEVKEILGVPADEGWNQAGCVLMGYPTGRWGVAERQPVQQVSYRNRWGEPLGVEVTDPLWP